MNLPSRGLRESVTTIRNMGAFLRPVRRRRMRTAMEIVLLDQRVRTSTGLLANWVFPSRTRDRYLPHAEHVRTELAAAALSGRGLLHHLLHLAELLEEPVHLTDRPAGAARHACPARAVHDAGGLALVRRHRKDNRLDVLHASRVRGFDLLEHLRIDTGQHLQHALQRPELLDLPHRGEEVIQIHALLAHLFLQTLGFVRVKRLLRFLHETDDVALLENAARHAVRVKLLERLRLFADADVLDRLLRHAVDRERRTATRITVHLRENDTGNVQPLIESLGNAHRVLTGHPIGDEENFVGMDLALEMIELRHHLVVDLQPAGGVDDDHTIAVAPRCVDSRLGDADDVGRTAIGVDGHIELRAECLELVNGGWTVDVGGNEACRLALGFELARELGGRCRLSGALQANHHDDGRRHGAELERFTTFAEHRRELVIDDLDELLSWRNGAQLRDADRLLLDPFQEFTGELKVDIGLEEDTADLAESFLYIGFIEDPTSAESRERRLEFFTELVEHSPET